VEQYRPSDGRRDVVEPRQCVFVGTTNKSAYLRDETGGRRFWPVRVGVIDTVALSRDRTQLFAEALVRFRGGSLWWPDGEFEARHIRPQQDARHEADAWEQPLLEFLVQRDRTTIHEIATEALHITTGKLGTIDQRRISCCLERLQWRRLPKDSHGRIPWGPIDVADHAARKAAFRKEAIKPSILVPEDEFA
jgi:predicted P-loop ATPase